MAPAFVTGPALSTRSTFTGTFSTKSSSTCEFSTSTTTPNTKMSAGEPMSRRRILLAGTALVAGAPLAALAKSGDSPNISIFGVGGASSPFVAGIQQGGKVLYSQYNSDEIEIFKRIVDESKDRLEGAVDSIKTKSWEDIRSRCRLEAGELRKVQLKVNDSIVDKDLAKKAKKAAYNVKLDLEQLDQAAVQKNQDSAFKKYNAFLKDINEWKQVVGLE